MMIFPDDPNSEPLYLPSKPSAPATGLVPLSQAPSQSQSSFIEEDDDTPTLPELGTGSSSGFPSSPSVPSGLPVRPTKRLNSRVRLYIILFVLIALLVGGLLLAASPQQSSTPQVPHLQPGATPPAVATPVPVTTSTAIPTPSPAATTPTATPTQSPKDCLREAMRVILTNIGGQSHCFSFYGGGTQIIVLHPPLRGIQMICSTVAVTANYNASEDPAGASGSQNDLFVFVPAFHCEWTRPATGKESMIITEIVLAQA